MVTPIYLSDTTAIYDRLTARAFLAEKLESDSRIKDFLVYLSGENWENHWLRTNHLNTPHKTFLLNIVTKPIHYV